MEERTKEQPVWKKQTNKRYLSFLSTYTIHPSIHPSIHLSMKMTGTTVRSLAPAASRGLSSRYRSVRPPCLGRGWGSCSHVNRPYSCVRRLATIGSSGRGLHVYCTGPRCEEGGVLEVGGGRWSSASLFLIGTPL